MCVCVCVCVLNRWVAPALLLRRLNQPRIHCASMYRAVDGAGACVDWPIARSSLSSSDPPASLLILEPIETHTPPKNGLIALRVLKSKFSVIQRFISVGATKTNTRRIVLESCWPRTWMCSWFSFLLVRNRPIDASAIGYFGMFLTTP